MGKRGRPSNYTAAEDAIILRHRETDAARRALVEAGFPERTPAALWSRRKYLREGGGTDVESDMLTDEDAAVLLLAKRRRLRDRLAALEQEAAGLRGEIENITDQLRTLVDGP